MTVRRMAQWMVTSDERLLERLEEEGWSTPRSLARAVDQPTGITRDRLRLLADAGLVAFATNDYDLVHLTTSGALYLEGERDQAEHPHPFDVRRATRALGG
jgi:hypothetical protein